MYCSHAPLKVPGDDEHIRINIVIDPEIGSPLQNIVTCPTAIHNSTRFRHQMTASN